MEDEETSGEAVAHEDEPTPIYDALTAAVRDKEKASLRVAAGGAVVTLR
jgi:hypothetical protein